jgi:release factor glutamine methyltransferase
MIKNTLQHAKKILGNNHIPSASLDAELLLAHVLKTTREQIVCYPERILGGDEQIRFESAIARRARREPISHILGKREFWGLDFKVNKHTLDPRPDSETLIAAALPLYTPEKALKILDFGTGSGCLLLALLSEFQAANGTGVDISPEALAVAKENSRDLGLAKRSDFIVSRWGDEVTGAFDLIISNPPYIKSCDIAGLEPEVSQYEPLGALDGGDSGLECYEELAPFINSFLSAGGYAILELGMGQDNDVKIILENAGLKFIAFKKDLAGINRCVVVRK